MTGRGRRDPLGEAVRREAAAWFARLHGPHDEADVTRFDAWRAADPAHGIAYDRLTQTAERAAFIGNSEFGKARQLRRASFLSRHPRTAYAAAASFAALALFGIPIGSRYFATSWPTRETAAAEPRFTTRIGEVRTVFLADGSRLTIDTASVVRTDLSGSQRQLWLDAGRARFEVAHDPRRPFVVHAGRGTVIAHGTIFEVSLTPVGVKVVLLQGAIEVRRPAAGGLGATSRYLAPDQEMTFDAVHPLAAPEPARDGERLWASGMLDFNDIRLADAVAAINRYHAQKLSVATSAIGNKKVTGAFRASDLEGFAQAMAAAFDLTVVNQSGTIILAASGPTAQR